MKKVNMPIDLLILSDGNPRLEPSLGENEAIYNMVFDQNDKLYELALDIVEYGLNPLEIMGVYPSETYDGFYEVGEGNRRLCALKLLINPDRIRYINPSLYSKFKNLSKEYFSPPSIDVVVFDDVNAMNHWMEIRHMGEQKGKGLSKWNSVQKSRYLQNQTGKDDLMDFWDWMISECILSKEEIYQVTKTNWQRILREKYFDFLKINYNDGYYVLPNDINTFTERIKAVQKELAGQTVAIVYDKSKIEEFYNLIANKLYGKTYCEVIAEEDAQETIEHIDIHELCNNDCLCNNNADTTESNYGFDNNVAVALKEDNKESDTQSIGRDVFNGCATIIPYGYSIRTENMRLNKIINELKRINADDFPNACGTLLRALFELSAKVYLEKQTGDDFTGIEFAIVIRKAANELRSQLRINNSEHSAIVSEIDNLRKIFNGYMHNTDGYPSSESLKNFFKCHRVFIQECLR